MSWLGKLFEREAPAERRLAEALVAWNAADYGVALDLWAPLAQAGHARAQSNMGAAFLEGRGVERDHEKAAAWLRRAAEQGDAGGQRNLALCYYEGWGVPQDQVEAARWYEKAAEQGDPDAQDMLSWMKLVGGGCPQDYVGARQWAEKAAAHGRAGAMARLGDIHHNALGVERDPAMAARWWSDAARRGQAEAQAMLGAAHLAGKGVAHDPVEALPDQIADDPLEEGPSLDRGHGLRQAGQRPIVQHRQNAAPPIRHRQRGNQATPDSPSPDYDRGQW